MKTHRFLIGSYAENQGIWELKADLDRQEIFSCRCVSNTRRNSYLALAGEICYAVSEVPLAEGSTGKLHSFHVSEQGLEPLDTLEGLPPLLPHLAVNGAGTVVYTASYGTGDVLAISVSDGKFGSILSHTKNTGSSVDPRRQTCAHPHSVWLSPDEQFLFLCDLGTDQILSWPLTEAGGLVTERKQTLSVPAGYGPRHMAFSADGSRAYVITEMAWHVLELAVSGGEMTLLRDISLEGDIPRQDQGGGAIRLSRDGKTLFCSNRGKENSRICVLSADTMAPCQNLTDCSWPRDFQLSEDGAFLLCANQTEDSLSLFRRNSVDAWTFFWKVTGIPSPVCLVEL